ncbi:MAG TPA: hypothetical protein PLY23_08775 [Alphaproteobacteria bacterium]|nr:hypothetical protein [Alphaproteobacteria bacterium]HQS94727.1 hypothetical protein [Alphaproteobacteria bacterium]
MKHVNSKITLSCLGIVIGLSLLSACECPKSTKPEKTSPETTTEEHVGKKILNDRHLRSPIDDFAR